MPVQLPQEVSKLFQEANFGHLATILPDGTPQVTIVWVDYDGKHVIVNTAEGRVKVKNVRRDPRVAISIVAQDNPFATASVRGRVVEITRDGADAHIDKQAKKYLGQDKYPFRQPDEVRILLKIEPVRVWKMG